MAKKHSMYLPRCEFLKYNEKRTWYYCAGNDAVICDLDGYTGACDGCKHNKDRFYAPATDMQACTTRDPGRIFPLCNKIAALWQKKYPDWRFTQLMSNFFSWYGGDPFYMEDDDFLALFEKYLNNE